MLRLLINLDRSPDRLKEFHLTFAEKCPGLSFTRIQAVEGKTLSKDYLQSLLPPLYSGMKVDFLGQLIDTEVGCFLSHKKCWQALLDSTEQWALIMEDDIELSSDAMSYMSDESWIPDGVSIVQLHVFCNYPKILSHKTVKPLESGRKLIRQYRPAPMGCLAYLINREAATLAIDLSKKIPAPVDDFLFQPYSSFRQHFETWTLSPAVVRPKSNVESTIGGPKKRSKRKKFLALNVHPVRVWRKIKRKWAYLFLCEKNTNSFR